VGFDQSFELISSQFFYGVGAGKGKRDRAEEDK
jgi:hypothetical protein